MADGWHGYWQNKGRAGQPTRAPGSPREPARPRKAWQVECPPPTCWRFLDAFRRQGFDIQISKGHPKEELHAKVAFELHTLSVTTIQIFSHKIAKEWDQGAAASGSNAPFTASSSGGQTQPKINLLEAFGLDPDLDSGRFHHLAGGIDSWCYSVHPSSRCAPPPWPHPSHAMPFGS